MQNDREFNDDRMRPEVAAERQPIPGDHPETTRDSALDERQHRRPESFGESPATETDRTVEGDQMAATNGANNHGLNPEIEARLAEIQAQFIDDPASAVRSAESLIQDAVDHMMEDVRRQVEEIRGSTGDGRDTERMRLAMREYKSMLMRLSI